MSLISNQYLKIVDLISEGPIKGLVNGKGSIYIDGVPLQNSLGDDNYKGFGFSSKRGTQDQKPLLGFNTIEREIGVGVPLKRSSHLSDSEIVTRRVTSNNVNAIRLNLSIDSLLRIDKKGRQHGSNIELEVEYSINNGEWLPASVTSHRYNSANSGNVLAVSGGIYGFLPNLSLQTEEYYAYYQDHLRRNPFDYAGAAEYARAQVAQDNPVETTTGEGSTLDEDIFTDTENIIDQPPIPTHVSTVSATVTWTRDVTGSKVVNIGNDDTAISDNTNVVAGPSIYSTINYWDSSDWRTRLLQTYPGQFIASDTTSLLVPVTTDLGTTIEVNNPFYIPPDNKDTVGTPTSQTQIGGSGTERTIETHSGESAEFTLQYEDANRKGIWITHIKDTFDATDSTVSAYSKSYVINADVTISQIRVLPTDASHNIKVTQQTAVQGTNKINISGKATSRVTQSYIFPLPSNYKTCNIRIKRITADSTETTLQNNMSWASFTEIINQKLSYPNSAIIGVLINSKLFSRVPARNYEVDGILVKVPTPAVQGIWNGTFEVAWSNNPAWILYDLITNNRYGLGKYISENQVDKWQFYELANYADELVPDGFGGMEKRYTLNTYIQNRQDAIRLLQTMCTMFRGILYWSNNTLSINFDRPSDEVQMFTNANVKDGKFNYAGSSKSSRHNAILISWKDPLNAYKDKKEFIRLDEDDVSTRGLIIKEVKGEGITSQGAAHRLGKSMLLIEKYLKEVVNFSPSVDCSGLIPGQVIDIYDKHRAGIDTGGRIVEKVNDRTVRLDREYTFISGKEYELTLATAESLTIPRGDGTEVDSLIPKKITRTITTSGVTTDLVTVGPNDDNEYINEDLIDNSLWGITIVNELNPQKFKVLDISENNSGTEYSVSAIEYNAGIYDAIERDLDIKILPIRSDYNTNLVPINISVQEESYTETTGVLKTKLFISWQILQGLDSNTVRYKVEFSKDYGNFEILKDNIETRSVELFDAEKGDYVFRITTKGPFEGSDKVAISPVFTVIGKTLAPNEIGRFNIEFLETTIKLTWDPVEDEDLAYYQLRCASISKVWENAEIVEEKITDTEYVIDYPDLETKNYFLKAINTSGIESAEAAIVDFTLKPPDSVENFLAVQSVDRIILNWDENLEPGITGYEIREGNSWESASFIGRIKSNNYTVVSGFRRNRDFLIKAIKYNVAYSLDATMSRLIILPVGKNFFYSKKEHPDFSGHKLNTQSPEIPLNVITGNNYGEYIADIILPNKISSGNTTVNKVLTTSDIKIGVPHITEIAFSDELTWEKAHTLTWQDLTTPWNEIIWPNIDRFITKVLHFRNEIHEKDIVSTPIIRNKTFQPCRFANGLVLEESSNTYKLHNQTSTSSQFHYTFWYKVADEPKDGFKIFSHNIKNVSFYYTQPTNEKGRFTLKIGEGNTGKIYSINTKPVKANDMLLFYISHDKIFIGDLETGEIYKYTPSSRISNFNEVNL